MKINHIVCAFLPYKSGIGNACLSQAKMGRSFNHEITVLTPKYKKLKAQKEEILDNLKIKRIKSVFEFGNSAYINTFPHIKQCDICQIHYPFYGSTGFSVFWAKIFRKKIVIFWHMIPEGTGLRGFIFKFYEKFITPIIFKYADKILVSTHDYFENYSPILFNKFKNKIIEFPFGVDINIFRPETKNLEIIKKYNLENKKILLFVGGLDKPHYFKGLEILIKALKELNNDYKLLVVGEGELKQYYQNLINELQIENKVAFAGSVLNQELIKYYNTCDCFIFPSLTKSEAFGIVQIEAMACAKPIIYSDLPGLRAVSVDNFTGFSFKTGDYLDLKQKIEKLFIDKINIFGQNARKRILENYNEAELCKKLNSIYENMYN